MIARVALLALLLAPVAAGRALAADPPNAAPLELQLVPAGNAAPRVTTAWDIDGVVYLRAGAISVLLDGAKYWRPELGRLTFTVGSHEMQITDGSDVAHIDAGRLFHLPGPAFLWEGQLYVPLDLVVDGRGEARPWIPRPVVYSREHRRLEATTSRGAVSGAGIHYGRDGWRLDIESDGPVRFDLVSADRSSFVVRITGADYDPMLYPLPTEHEWFQGLRLRNRADGLEVSFAPGSGARGYRVTQPDGNRVSILLGTDERDLRVGDLRAFTSVGRLSASNLVRVALDPGHGGSDTGSQVEGGAESYLATELAKLLQTRLQEDLGLDVVWTRGEKESASPGVRSDRANRERADLFLSLHFHPRPGGPAAFVADIDQSGVPVDPNLAVMGFRPAAGGQGPYLSTSRLIARYVVDAVGESLKQPVRGIFTEPIPALAGSAMPALLLEFGSGDGKNWTRDRLKRVAQGISEGLRLYQVAGETR